MKTIIGNWKSHKTNKETEEYFEIFSKKLSNSITKDKKVIISPAFTSLKTAFDLVKKYNLPIELASQNISSFPQGAYTGEIAATQVKEIATHCIIGHSERKRYLKENTQQIENKIKEARDAGLKIVLCVQNEHEDTSNEVDYIAYEPPSAIGSGEPDDPKHIEKVCSYIHEKAPKPTILYGGSVDEKNVKEFLAVEHISGFLIGGASLDPQSFINLIQKC